MSQLRQLAVFVEGAIMRTVRIILATVALAAMVIANTTAANSITYVVGNWQITLTDLGVLPGGTASGALAINNVGRIVGLATDSTFALQRPFWDANSGAITGFADNFDPASTAVPEQINDIGQMVGSEDYGNGRLFRGVFWNPQGQAFGLPPLAGVDPLFGSALNPQRRAFPRRGRRRQPPRRIPEAPATPASRRPRL
jgi:hypothetical protein